MIGGITAALGSLVSLVGLGAIALEWQYRRRPGNRLDLTPGTWNVTALEANHYQLQGHLEFCNRTRTLEIMVPEVSARVHLFSEASLAGVTTETRIIANHVDAPPRPDDYWFAYIVKIGKTTALTINIDIKGPNLDQLQCAWIPVRYVTYGPQGRIPKIRHLIIPLQSAPAAPLGTPRPVNNTEVYPIKTHLLTPQDDPVEIVKRYVVPHAQKGDIITIGETPVAIMQNRFRHPTDIQPGWVARRICYFFLPTSSLATACGLQALVDIVGPVRVLGAFIVGAIAKIFGKPGVFYQLAGEQARLIDDVTGTLPPYDQFIVLGPANPQKVVEEIQQETGLSAAIVDVNDLKAVKILAATPDIAPRLLEEALRSNPAGNADERTPLVLIRPQLPRP